MCLFDFILIIIVDLSIRISYLLSVTCIFIHVILSILMELSKYQHMSSNIMCDMCSGC